LSWKAGVVLALVVAVIAGMTWSAMFLDHRADRKRPMYRDMIRMLDLQYELLKEGKQPVLVRIHPKTGPVMIGDTEFTAERHSTILVEERDGQTCVQGNNQWHERTQWVCLDMSLGAPKLGALQ
jgi:hypothetical protein